MAATSPAAPAQPGPAGTPGIPRGAEGNVGGTAMGGTAASTTPAPPASAPAGAVNAALVPASAAAAPALTDAQNGQISLNASMDAVAARWRTRAAAQGHATHAPTPVDGVAGIQASAAPPATPPPAQDIRSEKFGTAPPSPDVKQATKPATRPVVDPKAPDAAGHKP
jgi:colicin import membrane protein